MYQYKIYFLNLLSIHRFLIVYIASRDVFIPNKLQW